MEELVAFNALHGPGRNSVKNASTILGLLSSQDFNANLAKEQ
jgi:hypothetical protein